MTSSKQVQGVLVRWNQGYYQCIHGLEQHDDPVTNSCSSPSRGQQGVGDDTNQTGAGLTLKRPISNLKLKNHMLGQRWTAAAAITALLGDWH